MKNALNVDCTNETSIVFQVNENPIIESLPNYVICEGEIQELDLLVYLKENSLDYNSETFEFTFYSTQENADLKEEKLNELQTLTDEGVFFVRKENKETNCYTTASFQIVFSDSED